MLKRAGSLAGVRGQHAPFLADSTAGTTTSAAVVVPAPTSHDPVNHRAGVATNRPVGPAPYPGDERTPPLFHASPRPLFFARAPPPRAPPPPPRPFGYRGGGQATEMANQLESAALAHAARLMAQQRVAGSARAGLPPRPPPRPTPGLPPQLPAGLPPRLPPRLAPGLGLDSPFVFFVKPPLMRLFPFLKIAPALLPGRFVL